MNKHKKYKIINFENSYCYVQDILTNQIYKCFSLDEHQIGDIVYLYSSNINIHTGNPIFYYSILNNYEVGKEYDFEISDEEDNKLLITDEFNNRLKIPISFKEYTNQDYITLKVEKFDLEKNKLVFEQKNLQSNVYDLSDFEKGKIYKFRVEAITESKNGLKFINSIYNNKKYSIVIPYQIKDIKVGEDVEVFLYQNKNGESKLNLTRKFIATKLYEFGKKYSFVIEDITISFYNGLEVCKLLDTRNNFKQDYYPSYDKTFSVENQNLKVGDNINLYVTNVNDKGSLYLSLKEIVNFDRTNYIIEDIFEKLGISEYLKPYFYDLVEYIDDDEQNNFLEQYQSGNNLWLFSYFTLLDKLIYLELEDGEFIQVKTILDLYTKLEKWMLLSGYINNFSPAKKNDIVRKAKQKNEKLLALESAVNLYIQNEEESYIQNINSQLKNTPVLFDDQKATLIELFRISHLINTDDYDLTTFNALYNFISSGMYDEDDSFKITTALEGKMISFKDDIINSINNEEVENKEKIVYFIEHLYLYQFFVIKNQDYDKATYNTLNLLKLCALYDSDKAIKYNNLIIDVIIKNQYIEVETLNNSILLDLDTQNCLRLLRELPFKNPFINAGKSVRLENQICLIPGNHFHSSATRINQLLTFDKYNLAIGSNFEKLNISQDLTAEELIIEVLKIHDLKYNKEILQANDFDTNTIYNGVIKAFDRDNKFVYVNSLINEKPIEFTLHVNYFDRLNCLENISLFIKKGDQISFNIIKNEDKKVYLKFNEEFSKYIDELIDQNDIHIIKIFKIDNQGAIGVSENGILVFLNDLNLILNKCYEVKLIDYNEQINAFIGYDHKLTNQQFVNNIESLYRKFLISSKFIQKPDVFDNNKILEVQLRFLMSAIESTISDDDQLKETILKFLFLYTISSILKSSKSYYYKQKLNNIYNILHITSEKENVELIEIDESTVSKFENLKTERIVYDLLNYFNSDNIDIPINIHSDNKYYKAKKLIESYNLIKQYNQNQDLFKFYQQLIISELLNNEKIIDKNLQIEGLIKIDEEINHPFLRNKTNLGIESKHQEFKSSFFYSASEIKQVDVVLRTINGFLNSFEGGKLFIGVNDDGDIIGLENDLNYENKKRTLDQYQNEIVSAINYGFPKEIATSFLDFKFHNLNQFVYLEIQIKPYDAPIHYKNEFWLRQANRTTILKGNDLTDFFKRKMNRSVSFKEEKVLEDNIISYNDIDNLQPIYNEDYYSEFKTEGQIQNNLFTNVEDDYLVTLYIFEDNTYLISKDEFKQDYLFKIRINEADKLSYLLMCYDNACVNKVDIRQIISKKLNRRYSNAMSDYGKLMATFISKDADHILIKTTCLNKEYVKIIHSNKITAHRSLGLKGNQIVQEEIDTVNKYLILTSDLANSYLDFVRESKQGYGAYLNSNYTNKLQGLNI
ncbi:AlbA family DNA-binding domain-containing protein [Empedobacter falsenii]|uniref:DNA binding domain-containing protein n=1 Tax=Empedobacter falsenii TaxID=343874 RepID=A0ABY8VAS4_9FLAO|nr:RNA-binding domain-containing protein [Empedobacter falsenii]WIH98217.1 putative DNA binding domain-containing protein [Empedobacter falsenii]